MAYHPTWCRFVWLLALLAAAVRADTITLNDGTVVEGTILEDSADSVTIKLKFGKATYQRNEIKSIQRAAAQPSATAQGELRDVLVLKSGEEHRGLLVGETADEVVFDLVVSGKSVAKALLTRSTFKKSEVKDLQKLTDAQRLLARNQLEKIETQAKQDVVAEQNIKIEPHEWETQNDHKKVAVKKVVLENFVIESNTDDAFLRRCAYRLGKVFAAYKQHFGVDRNQTGKVRVLLFNSMGEFYASVGGEIKNPAFYSPDRKIIAAGCDVAGYEALIKEIREHHAKLNLQLADYKRQLNEDRAKIAVAGAQLRDAIKKAGADGTAAGQAASEQMKAAQRDAQLEIGAIEKKINTCEEQIATCNRHNDQVFNDYTKLMFETLYHEGFHAFLDNFLFPPKDVESVPRWLNEGLAQYFECARIEGDRFVLGQEDREKMAMLRKWNKEKVTVPLDKLLTGDHNDYLVKDMSDVEHSTKHYLEAWCLTWLLGEKGRLNKENLHAYVQAIVEKKTALDALPILAGAGNDETKAGLDQKLKYSFGDQQPEPAVK